MPDVEVLIEFLNTIDVDSGIDELPDASGCAAWFAAHGLPTGDLDLAEIRRIRGALRAAVDGQAGDVTALTGVPLSVSLAGAEPTLRSSHPCGPLLITATQLVHEGQWERLKLCDMHTCRYAFFDESRNRSARWCSMRVCGNRAKTRAFRERTKH